MFGIFKKNKKPKQLYFVLAVADKPTDGFKFEADKDCKIFIVNGEIEKRDVIPRTVLKEVVERFLNPKNDSVKNENVDEADIKISESITNE